MRKDNFLFNGKWRDAISELPNDVRLEVYEAVIEYGLTGKLSVLKPIAAVAFSFIKQDIDRQQESYNETCERNRTNGSRGGNPNFRRGQPNPYYKITGDNRTLPEITEDNPKEREEEKEIDKKKNPTGVGEKENPGIFLSDTSVSAPKPSGNVSFSFLEVIDMWNNTCTDFHKLTGLSDKRKTKLKVRLDELSKIGEPLPLLQTLFKKMQDSQFLKGDNRRGWKATFDWLILNGENWRKVMEGNYDRNAPPTTPAKSPTQSMDDVVREAQELLKRKSDNQNTDSHGVQ